MIKYPKSVLDVARRAVEKYKEDTQLAAKEANKNVRRLKDFEELVDLIVFKAMQDLVYDIRHATNVQTRNDAKKYGPGPTVRPGTSKVALQPTQSVLETYYIGSTVLGSLKGSELGKIATDERLRANGHIFNANLCSRLQPLVPKNKTVRECVSQRKIDAIWQASSV